MSSRSSRRRLARNIVITGLFTAVVFATSAVSARELRPDRATAGEAHQQATQAQAAQPQTPGTASPTRQGGPGTSPWDWWSDPAIKKDLKLTEEQVRRIRELFEKREAEVKPLLDQLNREGDKLDRMTRERLADESTYAVQVSKVQHLFARVRESRTVMMYRMYRELQPEQYKKLQEIMDRRRAMDGRGSGPR